MSDVALDAESSTVSSAAGVSTRELLCWAGAYFAAISLSFGIKLWLSSATAGASWGQVSAIELIAWWCAFTLILRDSDATRPASPLQFGLVVFLAVCGLFVPGRFGVIALVPLGIFVLVSGGWTNGQRRAAAVFVAIGAQRLLASVIPILLGDLILRLDTAAAGMLMEVFFPGTTWTGNVLKPPGDVGITVFMACSSFANLSYVALCFVSLLVVDGGKWSRRAFGALSAISLAIIILNTARLVATARSIESYVYWHDGAGAEIFGIAMTIMTVALCSLGSRWASPAR